jgi:uncharacterized peroxidase-related enzyme
MTRLNVVEPDEAEGEVARTYESVRREMGTIPNIFRGMANSPAALRAYLCIDEALEDAALSEAERHIVYLAASQVNECNYCLSAHTLLGKKLGLSEQHLIDVRMGEVGDNKHRALVRFTRSVMENKGSIDDTTLEGFRMAGYGDAHAAEVCAVIAQATFSNYFNHVHETPLDFPEAPQLPRQSG